MLSEQAIPKYEEYTSPGILRKQEGRFRRQPEKFEFTMGKNEEPRPSNVTRPIQAALARTLKNYLK